MNQTQTNANLSCQLVRTTLDSIAPYSQGRALRSTKSPNESEDEFEQRCWRERCHVNGDGFIQIPPVAFKKSLVAAARLLSEPIRGKGKKTWTKQFECGILVTDPISLPIKLTEVEGDRLFLPARGDKDGGTRVWKILPIIHKWEATVCWYITSPLITEEIFQKYIEIAGMMIGIGVYRAERGGYYGRWVLKNMEWT